MAEAVYLTDILLRGLKPREKLYEIKDSLREGLWVRVHPSGRVTFCLRFRHRSHWLRKSYKGRYPGVSLKQARAMALEDLSRLSRGENPRKPVVSQELTLESLASEFSRLHLPQKAASTSREYQRILDRNILPGLGSQPAAEISTRQVVELLDAVGQKGPTMANRTRAVLSALFNFARRRGYELTNPVQGTEMKKEGSGERYLQGDEIAEVWQPLEASGTAAGRAVLFALCTGQRSGEIRHLRWQDLSDGEQEPQGAGGLWWELPSWLAKNRRAHLVPLRSLATSLVEAQAVLRESEFVFPSPLTFGTLSEKALAQYVRRLCRRLGWSGDRSFTPHDLRRTVETGMARLGVDQFVVDRCLNHRMGGVRERYNRWHYSPQKAEAFETWNQHLLSLLGAGPGGAGGRQSPVVI